MHTRSLILTALLTTLPATALAQNEGPREHTADVAFQEAKTLLAKGNIAEACVKFGESDRIAPSGRAVLNLADCLERRGLTASAYTKFLEAASRAVQANRPDAERHARERAAQLEPRLARVSIVVPKESEVPGLEIRHNGVVVPQASWSSSELADPGTSHTFEATAPGKSPWTTTLNVEEGKTARAELRWQEVPPAAAASVSASASASAAPAPRGSTSRSSDVDGEPQPARREFETGARPLAFTALGIGAAGLAVGAFGGLKVLSAKSTVDAHCNTATRACDQEGLDAASSGKTWSVVSPLALGVGAIGVGVGGYVLLRGDHDRQNEHDRARTAPRIAVSPSIAPGTAGLVIGGRI